MARALTNKQRVVLAELRRHPGGVDAQTMSDAIPPATCVACAGTGGPQPEDHERARKMYDEHHDEYPSLKPEADRCARCHGHGTRRIDIAAARNALERLVKEGLATRRNLRDEWGDPIRARVVYEPAPDPDDPLEKAFHGPAAEEPKL